MTTPSAPVPGFYPASPHSWQPGDQITVPRLRADAYNVAVLMTQGRPLVLGQVLGGPAVPDNAVSLIGTITTFLNSWNVPLQPVSGAGAATYYPVPLAGWYLANCYIQQRPVSGGNAARYVNGIQTIANGGTVFYDTGAVPWVSTGTPAFQVAGNGCELVELNSGTSDNISWYAFNNNSTGTTAEPHSYLSAEWVGLPSGTLTGWTGPVGTVVAAPAAAASFPPGPGVTLSSPVVAGAGTIVCSAVTGMVAGGTIGLDYLNGMLYQPVAETAGISSLPGGGTVILTGHTAYAHASGAPVAVPVSAAFLNQQVRDQVNFLTYPPMLRAVAGTIQSIAQNNLPTGTQVTHLSATATGCIDNFSGFASNEYTFPVAGVWLCYGMVYYAGATTATDYGAGLQVNSGTIQWGDYFQSDTTGGAQAFAAGVRRHLRVNAGDTLKLYGSQNSGAAMNTVASANSYSKLICIWRAV